jgi:hypothetical protein
MSSAYRSGVLVPRWDHSRAPPFEGAGWVLDLKPVNSRANPSLKIRDAPPGLKPYRGMRELVVLVESWAVAREALLLFHFAAALLDGNIPGRRFFGVDLPPIPVPKRQDDLAGLEPEDIDFVRRNAGSPRQGERLLTAAALAARISTDESAQYALHRYYQSLSIFTVDLAALHPKYGDEVFATSRLRATQVALGTAIFSAYACLEDLEVSIAPPERGTPRQTQKPRRTSDWDPAMRKRLEERLIRRGIDTNSPFAWHIRGSGRVLDKVQRQSRPSTRSERSDPEDAIHDIKFPLMDAISQAAWLRNRVGAHAIGTLAHDLTIVDVANAQQLARRLILEAMGFWKNN